MSHFIYHDLGRIEYEKALERQTIAFNALLEAKAQGRTGENRLFFCEHQPVLTIGKNVNLCTVFFFLRTCRLPFCFNQSCTLAVRKVQNIDTVCPVNGNTSASCDKTDDFITWNRITAL